MMKQRRAVLEQSGTQALLEAMGQGKLHLARFILDALDRRIVDAQVPSGQTLLTHAASVLDSSRAAFLRLLLDSGADVNAQDSEGRTALSHASEKGHMDAVRLLVQRGADPHVSDHDGRSAIAHASRAGQSDALQFLLRAFKRFGLRDHSVARAARRHGDAHGSEAELSSCAFGPDADEERSGKQEEDEEDYEDDEGVLRELGALVAALPGGSLGNASRRRGDGQGEGGEDADKEPDTNTSPCSYLGEGDVRTHE